jgi:uncharacterized protein (DUF362 family)
MHPNKNAVAVRHCQSYDPERVYECVCSLLDHLGGVLRFARPGMRVLIKPNLIVPKPPSVPAQTHPEVIYALARRITEAGAHVLVGDSPAWSDTAGCLKALGVYERLCELNVEIIQLNRPVKTRIEGADVGISRAALEADAIINVPKLKAHQQLGATFALKNMYGCICGLGGKEKAYWHFARGHDKALFCRMVVGVYQKLSPVLTIIDGIVAMEGQGPINGQPRNVGYLVAGVDPVACERVCCDLVGFRPAELPLLQTAVKMNVGLPFSKPVELLGDRFDAPVCPDFKPATLTPLRFSFGRILKSISKQIAILMKSAVSSRH